MLCSVGYVVLFFYKQKTAYELRISDWSSDVCSSDLLIRSILHLPRFGPICIDRLQLPRDLSVIVPTVSIPEGDITMKTLLKTAMLTGACMIAAPALAQT